ncbi:MAG: hypothetical protein IJS01_10455 [Lentisphaeria bacterium]|nr:hypothetical protein [Lentisphaeria bacterium]
MEKSTEKIATFRTFPVPKVVANVSINAGPSGLAFPRAVGYISLIVQEK